MGTYTDWEFAEMDRKFCERMDREAEQRRKKNLNQGSQKAAEVSQPREAGVPLAGYGLGTADEHGK